MSCCAEHHVLSSAPAYILEAWSTSPYLTTLLLGPPLLVLLLFYPALLYLSPREKRLGNEAFFYTTASDSNGRQSLPKLMEECKGDDARIQLSVVVPAYNEQSRLQKMLKETVSYLEKLKSEGKSITSIKPSHQNGHGDHQPHSSKSALEEPLQYYEILIIDDGSKDETVSQALSFAQVNKNVDFRIVKMGQNCGKGAAVRHGVLHSRGQVILFCDADGATRFADVSVLAKELGRIMTPAGHGIVCGSRAHLVGSEAVVKVSRPELSEKTAID
jgi:dolichyl-phosphate beta-glucosyltransferase